MKKPVIHVIIASTRKNRRGPVVAQWVLKVAQANTKAKFELVDLMDWQMPNYNEVAGPKGLKGVYETQGAKEWAAKVKEADGFIIVTPEYNHGYPGALKNCLDYVYDEWNNKPVAFVSYGGMAGGVRAVEQLRLVSVEMQMATIREEVNIPRIAQAFTPEGQPVEQALNKKAELVIEQLLWWTFALKHAREHGVSECCMHGDD